MSKDKAPFTLLNENYFPKFDALPEENDIDPHYYQVDERSDFIIASPRKHWCLLTEIVEIVPYWRPTFILKDKTGRKFPCFFYLDNGVEFPRKWRQKAQPGNTMVFLYPNSHLFFDTRVGLRIEEIDHRTLIFPCSLQEFFKLEEVVKIEARSTKKQQDSVGGSANEVECARKTCGEPGKLKCPSCKVTSYCGEECRKIDWKQGCHKKVCTAINTVQSWSVRRWDKFDGFW